MSIASSATFLSDIADSGFSSLDSDGCDEGPGIVYSTVLIGTDTFVLGATGTDDEPSSN